MSAAPHPSSTATLHAVEAMSALNDAARAVGHAPGEAAWERYPEGVRALAVRCGQCSALWRVFRYDDRFSLHGDWCLEPCNGGAS